ncbi:hypothetical protein U9M48_036111 [Paspalum notatum var. saurae]|uniref:HAT C-terminal dimerisation domain-containing protein n=1 Tax=Paspalum notatum var. saurae TaxID=547442 RepID=A0AAQ3UDE7_PASNO
MDVRWNSIYLMLKHLLPYKETFDMFLTTQYPRKPSDLELLTPAHWYVAAKLLEFLELFYDATISLSTTSGWLNSLETELTSYLNSDTLQKFDDDFNLLNWWHEHKVTYPVLSILAGDVISVTVSTISSEFAFSLCGRIIEERR